ncbi:hypothetical protein HK097_006609, partial [Rhizophlyctis rosea]
MTSYESLLWNVWLPKVRQAVNNTWNPRHPDHIILLLESWHPTSASLPTSSMNPTSDALTPLLPSWLHANILDQLIMPKLEREAENWDPRTDTVPVHTWLHPWLPVLGERMETVHAGVRRKLTKSLEEWWVGDESALAVLGPWKEVFTPADFENLLSRSILPKLISALRQDFTINPAAQNLEPLFWVLKWYTLMPTHLLVHLLETEFFPQWHHVLWSWLCSENASRDEIAQWYLSWKGVIPPALIEEEGIARQFKAGLDMMNLAMVKGERMGGPMPPVPGPIALEKPGSEQQKERRRREARSDVRNSSARDGFREFVERIAAEHDLLFLPSGRVSEGGKVLFRLGGDLG